MVIMHQVSAIFAHAVLPTYPFCSHGNISGCPPSVQSTFLRLLNSLEDTEINYGRTVVIIVQLESLTIWLLNIRIHWGCNFLSQALRWVPRMPTYLVESKISNPFYRESLFNNFYATRLND